MVVYLEFMKKTRNLDLKNLSIDGGMVKNKFFLQIISDLMDIELSIPEMEDIIAILLNKLGQYVVIYKKIWSEQKFLTANSKILVCCDKAYDKKDYIYNLMDLSR